MNPLIIYHDNCADGFGAAFSAWLKFGDDAEYVPMQYGTVKNTDPEIAWNELSEAIPNGVEGRDVYILDFSLPKPVMEKLIEVSTRFVWLDHHKTAFESWFAEMPLHWEQTDTKWITLDNNKSGAVLAWEYFRTSQVPKLIKHIDDRDRWKFEFFGTKELNAVLWSLRPWTFKQWNNLLVLNIQILISEGRGILRAHEQNVKSVVESNSMVCTIVINDEAYVGRMANCLPHLVSDVGHELANQSSTYGLGWHMNKEGRFFCSFRSNGEYDVSAIAKYFGGGGHHNAAGCEVTLEQLMSWPVLG